jgi:hypothetical protein
MRLRSPLFWTSEKSVCGDRFSITQLKIQQERGRWDCLCRDGWVGLSALKFYFEARLVEIFTYAKCMTCE